MGGKKTDLLSSLFLRRRWSWVWRGREEEHWQPRPSHPVLHPAPPGTSLGGAPWDGGGGNDGGDAGDDSDGDGDLADLVSRVRRTDWPGPGWREVVQERAPSSPHSRGDGEGLKEQVKVQVKVKVDSPSQPPCELW